jgi:hypothetical protein
MKVDETLWRLLKDLYECAELYQAKVASMPEKYWAETLQCRIEDYAESQGLDCADVFAELARKP